LPVSETNIMTYQSRLYAEHALKPGREVIRLSCTRDGKPWTCLYLYDTAAAIDEDMGGLNRMPGFKRERVKWDGVEEVSVYNGD
jgi:hypothetical protein